jgi:spermidine/putrescine transport system permease protein
VGDGARLALGGGRVKRVRDWWANPWGQPRFLAVVTWAYMAWSIIPVCIAILFSFNDGKSRSVWQGFSFRWYWGDPNQSVWNDPSLRGALEQSLKLACFDMLIAVPLGVGLAIGLTRWRGFGARPVNFLMLFPLVTPEIVMAVSLLLIFTTLYKVQLGTTAQVLGQVTFSVSYVVLVVRSRLLSIGPEYEEAARDLGASRIGALRLVLLPLLTPAIFASLVVVFALSIDDFVVTDYLSSNESTQTVPIKIYSSVRGTATPALNAVATVLVVATLCAVLLAGLVYKKVNAKQSAEKGSALHDIAALEM